MDAQDRKEIMNVIFQEYKKQLKEKANKEKDNKNK